MQYPHDKGVRQFVEGVRYMKGKVLFCFNELCCDRIWSKTSGATQKTITDFVETVPAAGTSDWGSRLLREELKYQFQIVADAKGDVSGKELLMTTGYVLEDNQRLEYYSTDTEYDTYTYCEQRHFSKGDLSGAFSGVKFRGALADILRAYDDIMGLFGSLRVHMISISCTKSYDGLTAEIQLEYDDYILEKAYFTEIVNKHPNLRMMAISIPEGRWENWFFFTSGSYSTSIKAEEIRYERTADPDYYWAKSTYFDEDDWLLGDFIFVERERRTDVYPNVFNWSETLEYPSHYWGKKSLRFCAVQTRHAKKIILPSVAQHITSGSFSNCTNLKEIVMPSVTEINQDAFFKCKALNKLVVSEKLVEIDETAFVDCGNFKVVAPAGSYAEEFFSTENECHDPDFIVKNGVLQKYAGKGPVVIVPNSVREIGNLVFCGNKNIFEVVLPFALEGLPPGAFYNCSNLEKVSLPEGLKKICAQTFAQCKKLREINIPETVAEIADGAFFGCTALPAITIPSTVTKIGLEAFQDCKNLASVTIHSDKITYGSGAFAGCKKLMDKKKQVVVANVLFDYFGTEENVVIPDGIIALGDYAFFSSDNLRSVTVPDSVAAIGPNTFPLWKDDFILCVPAGSYAERYAKENKIKVSTWTKEV